MAERGGAPLGFAGVAEGNLEMLFVADRGQGVSSALLNHATSSLGATKVDVNEQNPAACDFYLNRGFIQVGRSELDADGQPYPTLHLQLKA